MANVRFLRGLSISLAMAGAMSAAMASAQTRQEPPAAVASIGVSRSSSGLLLRGGVLALTSGTYKAQMDIDRTGAGGTMKTRQQGVLVLKAGQSGTIATVGVSFHPGDALDIRLVVESGDHNVSQARVTLN
ncbi:curli-like amyloid fiber formation chaperone CsgH [Solirhodobacter olei]|uniref:curli-like amyloid fiber formation chaperone CsgH n=1 Tax=Solirhodobacter olei TaxID=2493082 RepID=UPI0013E31C30|nr:curli-like amyloid fiber formation chaperone CsgH [Solirhodobacter olei]